MCNMPTEGIKIEKHFRKNLGLYFTDGFRSDGSVVKGINHLNFWKKTMYSLNPQSMHIGIISITLLVAQLPNSLP